jgi:hypothetical protein
VKLNTIFAYLKNTKQNVLRLMNVQTIGENTMIKKWINARMKERTSWDGAALVLLGLMVLFLAPLAKIAAGLAIAYGAWTIYKSE